MTRRQHERERGALADLRMHIQLQLEQFHEPLHDAQAESVAFSRAVGRHPDLVELVVDVRDVVRRYADSRVRDLEPDERLFVQAAQSYPTLAGVLQRVRD